MAASLTWADLPWPLQHHILAQLSDLLHQDAGGGPISLVAAAAATAAAAPNRHWRVAAAAALRLQVQCGCTPDELSQLLRLSRRARLVALHFAGPAAAPPDPLRSRPPHVEPPDLSPVFELLQQPAFEEAAGPHLLALRGAPFASPAGRRHMLRFSSLLAAYPWLRTLQLEAAHLAALSEPAWQAASSLRSLHVCGLHYVAVRVLPPNLQELSVTAWNVLIPPPTLVRCPNVRRSEGRTP